MNPLLATAEIQAFLDSFPSASRRRGRHYYYDGTVTELACVEAGAAYSAVVIGSQEYEVAFDYDAQTHSWSAECTCPVGFQCNHAYAAMLALQANATLLSVSAAPVTDFSAIEPVMRVWQRQKNIEHWRQPLRVHQLAFHRESEPVDFRLLILPEEARVRWKTEAQGKFKDLKQTHLRRFNWSYQAGELNLVPEAAPLWAAIQNPYDFSTPCHFGFERQETARMLNRVLRLPALADRILTADELPLARPAEPLRYQLQPARDESDDYALQLVLADGSPAPPILLVLPGQPPSISPPRPSIPARSRTVLRRASRCASRHPRLNASKGSISCKVSSWTCRRAWPSASGAWERSWKSLRA